MPQVSYILCCIDVYCVIRTVKNEAPSHPFFTSLLTYRVGKLGGIETTLTWEVRPTYGA
jgi:hypothetical protein